MIANFHYLAKVNGTRYPALQELIGGYFHEDYDLIGGTFNEIIQAYIEGADPAARKLVVKEVERFKRNSEGDFDTAYRMEFIDHIDFSYWGFTYVIFINEVRKLLKRSLRKKKGATQAPFRYPIRQIQAASRLASLSFVSTKSCGRLCCSWVNSSSCSASSCCQAAWSIEVTCWNCASEKSTPLQFRSA